MQDRIRHLHRELLQQARALHPTLRIVDMLVVGLASKNNRTRVEAAEALGDIIADEGVPAIEKARHRPLPALAQVRPLRHHELASAIEALVPPRQADGCLPLEEAWRRPLLVWVDLVCRCSSVQGCLQAVRGVEWSALVQTGPCWCHRDPSAWVGR